MRKASDTAADSRRKALGAAIRRARGRRTQTEVAKRLGVPQPSLCRWEQGRYELTLEQVRKLEVELAIPPGSLAASAGYTDDRNLHLRPEPVRVLYPATGESAAAALRAAEHLGLSVTVEMYVSNELGDTEVDRRWTVLVHGSTTGR